MIADVSSLIVRFATRTRATRKQTEYRATTGIISAGNDSVYAKIFLAILSKAKRIAASS
jgi:hypothetical protein